MKKFIIFSLVLVSYSVFFNFHYSNLFSMEEREKMDWQATDEKVEKHLPIEIKDIIQKYYLANLLYSKLHNLLSPSYEVAKSGGLTQTQKQHLIDEIKNIITQISRLPIDTQKRIFRGWYGNGGNLLYKAIHFASSEDSGEKGMLVINLLLDAIKTLPQEDIVQILTNASPYYTIWNFPAMDNLSTELLQLILHFLDANLSKENQLKVIKIYKSVPILRNALIHSNYDFVKMLTNFLKRFLPQEQLDLLLQENQNGKKYNQNIRLAYDSPRNRQIVWEIVDMVEQRIKELKKEIAPQ